MDEMRIRSKLMRGLIGKTASKSIRSKTGYDVDIALNEVEATVEDGTVHLHLSVDANLDKGEFDKLIKTIGL